MLPSRCPRCADAHGRAEAWVSSRHHTAGRTAGEAASRAFKASAYRQTALTGEVVCSQQDKLCVQLGGLYTAGLVSALWI